MPLYAWIDSNNKICTTEIFENVPLNVNYVVFHDLTILDSEKLKESNGQIVLKTQDEFLTEKKEKIRKEVLDVIFQGVISQTDYILLQIQEAKELGLNPNAILQKYYLKLNWRKLLREWKEKKEREIINAKSEQELMSIDFYDYPKLT